MPCPHPELALQATKLLAFEQGAGDEAARAVFVRTMLIYAGRLDVQELQPCRLLIHQPYINVGRLHALLCIQSLCMWGSLHKHTWLLPKALG